MIQRHHYPYREYGGWCFSLQGVVDDDKIVHCMDCCFEVRLLVHDQSTVYGPPSKRS
jgi:hypothetical protein